MPQPYPPITEQPDKDMIRSMEGTTVGGKIVLPSGLTLPEPPKGSVWYIKDGRPTFKEKPSENAE